MATTWTTLSQDQARRHPLYGIKNWLLVFAVGVLLGLIKEFGSLVGEAGRVGLSISELLAIDHPAISFVKFALLLQVAVVAAIYVLLLSRSRHFRSVSSALLLGSWPALALGGVLNRTAGVVDGLALSFFAWALSCAVWVTYLNRSVRVRVTFENAVPAEPLGGGTIEPHAPVPFQPRTAADGVALASAVARGVTRSQPQSRATLKVEPKVEPEQAPRCGPEDFNDEEVWAAALAEVESPDRRPGLWAKCFAEAAGNASMAKSAYLTERVRQLDLAKKQERRQRELASAAERDRQALRAKLGKDEVELLDAVQFIQSNDKPPLAVLNTALGIMGGKWRPTGLLSLGRRVWFKNQQHEFRTDEEFRTWFNAEVLPVAELLLPDQRDGPPLGSCPNCEAWIPLDAAVCIGCEANFGRGSAWRPLASRIT